MEEQTVEWRIRKPFLWAFGALFGAMFLLALVGTVLGAINFISPAHYPSWILAIWLMVNILLELFIVVHVAIYAVASWRDADASFMVAVFGMIVILVAGIAMLQERHFGWFSACSLFLVCGFVFIDVLVVGKVLDKE